MSKICPVCKDPQNYITDPEFPDDDYCEKCSEVEEILEFIDEEKVINLDKSINIITNRLIDARIEKIKINYKIDKLKLLLAILDKQQMKNGLEKAFEEFEKKQE